MKVYLVQHGEAKSEIEDPQRSLTEKGKHEVESVAGYVASLEVEVAQILHSGRLASLLISGTPENEIVRFKMGGVVWLSESDKKWFVQWALVPELIHK